MRIFLDTNVWISAFAFPGLCREMLVLLLADRECHLHSLLTCPQVRAEVRRILQVKLGADASALALAEETLSVLEDVVLPDMPLLPDNFPDPDDWPILCSAVHAQADVFITGDKALLALGTVDGIPIVDPRTAYVRLRGLA